MKNGNWIPISKCFLKLLPHDREYTELEAAYSLQSDFDSKNKVTITGYCNLWRWSKGKVYRFLDRMNIKILYPESTSKKRNQNGLITVHKTDLKRTNDGLIRFIDNSDLQKEADLKRTKSGLKTDLKQVTTIDPITLKPNPKKKEKIYKKEKHLEFVFLTHDEFKKLQAKFGDSLDRWMERLNHYIGSTGKNYKSHYHTILAWWMKEKKESSVDKKLKSVFDNIEYSDKGRD